MTRILLAVNDNRLADHISGLAAESDDLEVAYTLRDPQELRGALPRTDIDAVVLHDRRGALPLIEVTRELTIAHPELGLVLIVAEDSPELLRSGMQAGARDVISEPIGLEQLEVSVMAAASWSQALRRRAARDASGELLGLGRVVTIVGAKGGVGTTTVAVHLALAARQLGEASVCLVEYDLQAGDLRAFLDLPFRRSVVDLAGVAEEVTSRHLQETLYAHPSGLRVLLAPQDGEQAEMVSAAAARNILTALRTREDLTIVDAGATLSEASAIAVEIADTVLIVTTPDVISLRGVVRLCSMWERLKVEPPEVAVLLNRTSRKLEVQPDLARRVVPVPVLETAVPANFFALEPAVNTGIPGADAASDAMLRPMAAVLGEISALPSRADAQTEIDRAKSIVARLAGESGQATVELTGLLPMLLVVLVALWQIVLIGMTFAFAGHAARAGARALAVGDPVAASATNDLPSAWRDSAQVSDSTEQTSATGNVQVKIDVPILLPGTFDLPIKIDSSAGTVIESQPLPGQLNLFSLMTGGLSGQAVPFGPALLSSPYSEITPGNRAVIDPRNGFAMAPANAPLAVKEILAAGNEIVGQPYVYGGGHGGPLDEISPNHYDCSSSVEHLLYGALLIGINFTPASGTLESWGAAGPGSWVTIEANAGHVYMYVAGLRWDTHDAAGPGDGTSGIGWHPLVRDNSGFVARHPVGL